MGFYKYFREAKKYCPEMLRGFEPALDYEVARIMQAWEYEVECEDRCFIEWAIRYAYDNIVERMGYQIAALNIRSSEEYVCVRNRKVRQKTDRRTSASIP